jgi:hypothetical protein
MTNPVIDEIGNQYWYDENGQYHRIDGPAVLEVSGIQIWCINGKAHRTDGPAYIRLDGEQEWWVNGKFYFDNKSFQEAAGITNEQMQDIIAKYGDVK